MQWFDNLRISRKLTVGFGIVAVLTATVGFIGTTQIRKVQQADEKLYSDLTVPLSWIGEVSSSFRVTRLGVRDAILTDAPDKKAAAMAKSDAYKVRVDSLMQLYGSSLYDKEDTVNFGTLKSIFADAERFRLGETAAIRANNSREAIRLLADPSNPAGRADSLLQRMVDLNVLCLETPRHHRRPKGGTGPLFPFAK